MTNQLDGAPAANIPASNEKKTLWGRFCRLCRYRLIIPLKRSRHPPEYTARGVAVGLFWAFTPLVGIQMLLVLATWIPVRGRRRWDFSLIVALAWTWITNVATLFPIYYVFYVTGQLILGRWHDLSGYQAFVHVWHEAFGGEHGIVESLRIFAMLVARVQGLAMAVGWIPHALFFGWLGHRWTARYLHHRRTKKRERRRREHA